MTWDIREEIIVAAVRTAGHNMRHDYQAGWTRCAICAGGWNVRHRALVAAGIVTGEDARGWPQPLHIRVCK